MKHKFVTELIGEDYRDVWKPGDFIFIRTQTGSGKTSFVMKTLFSYSLNNAKRILLLVPRKILEKQIMSEMKKLWAENSDVYEEAVKCITVKTYQTVEHECLNGYNTVTYDYIVCDEAHYFLADATFNANTQLSYEYVMQQKQAVKLFMSATIDNIEKYIITKENLSPIIKTGRFSLHIPERTYLDYSMDVDYGYINLAYISKVEDVINILKGAKERKEKTILFVHSKKEGEKIEEELNKACIKVEYVNAENKEETGEKTVNQLVRHNKFNCHVLIVTSVLDVGVNIKDIEVKNIIIGAFDRETFLQMLGRIRIIEEEQSMRLFIYRRNAYDFERYANNIENKLDLYNKMVNVSEDFRESIMLQMCLNDGNNLKILSELTYQSKSRTVYINPLTRWQLNYLYAEYMENADNLVRDTDFFIKKQLSWLGMDEGYSAENYIDGEAREIRRKKMFFDIDDIIRKFPDEYSFEEMKKIREDLTRIIRKFEKSLIRSNETMSNKRFNEICILYNLPYHIQTIAGRKKQYKFVRNNE